MAFVVCSKQIKLEWIILYNYMELHANVVRLHAPLNYKSSSGLPSYVDKLLGRRRLGKHLNAVPDLEVDILIVPGDTSKRKERKAMEIMEIKNGRPVINTRRELTIPISLRKADSLCTLSMHMHRLPVLRHYYVIL